MKFGRRNLFWRGLRWAERACRVLWWLSLILFGSAVVTIVIYLYETGLDASSISPSLHLLSAVLLISACSGMLLKVVHWKRRRRVRSY